ncbi:MAG TPA: GTPase Era [Syntrophales bacterium]|nr:GTPase Era [Syntrophales bacterium]HOM06489.1 GTPase Era [Syntrophales bacterium]HON99874.1 GTPase Era [Syntrophales bacterium]HPQ06249.1 GTPase Era [Syntrophales bacterium]HRS86291.1 GTPase Era [Syntrophales bacterium]
MGFKSGFIGIIGRPNVGKSTLLNALVGERIAITTPKPQTTRNRITGIKNVPGAQLVFIDTPGIHRAATPLNRVMVETARQVVGSVDILLLLGEAHVGIQAGDLEIIETLKGVGKPVLLALNKADLAGERDLGQSRDQWAALYPFAAVVTLSALKTAGVDTLVETILSILPEGPPFFPEDMFTDRSERFLAAEMIREKIMLLTREEIPYAVAVTVDAFKEDEGRNLINMAATVTVEKASQKGIIIGKGGEMIKRIGTEARRDLEAFFGARVFLELFVRVRRDWKRDEGMLKDLGYRE